MATESKVSLIDMVLHSAERDGRYKLAVEREPKALDKSWPVRCVNGRTRFIQQVGRLRAGVQMNRPQYLEM